VNVDICGTRKHPRVKRGLAAPPRFHVHLTLTGVSWLNQVEIWFNGITQQGIRHGTFRSVKELVGEIDQYVHTSNPLAHPFVWTATDVLIFAKGQRLCERIPEALRWVEQSMFCALGGKRLGDRVPQMLALDAAPGEQNDAVGAVLSSDANRLEQPPGRIETRWRIVHERIIGCS
jgi:hypothetical protein